VPECWDKIINPQLSRGTWSREEDEIFVNFENENRDKCWPCLAQFFSGCIGNQCREKFKTKFSFEKASIHYTFDAHH
jgi:hypothetical protein